MTATTGRPSSAPVELTGQRRQELNRRAQRLAWARVTYNAGEGLVAVLAGLAAGSVALVGFGPDSAVEVLSALAVNWQFNGRVDARERENTALHLIPGRSSRSPALIRTSPSAGSQPGAVPGLSYQQRPPEPVLAALTPLLGGGQRLRMSRRRVLGRAGGRAVAATGRRGCSSTSRTQPTDRRGLANGAAAEE